MAPRGGSCRQQPPWHALLAAPPAPAYLGFHTFRLLRGAQVCSVRCRGGPPSTSGASGGSMRSNTRCSPSHTCGRAVVWGRGERCGAGAGGAPWSGRAAKPQSTERPRCPPQHLLLAPWLDRQRPPLLLAPAMHAHVVHPLLPAAQGLGGGTSGAFGGSGAGPQQPAAEQHRPLLASPPAPPHTQHPAHPSSPVGPQRHAAVEPLLLPGVESGLSRAGPQRAQRAGLLGVAAPLLTPRHILLQLRLLLGHVCRVEPGAAGWEGPCRRRARGRGASGSGGGAPADSYCRRMRDSRAARTALASWPSLAAAATTGEARWWRTGPVGGRHGGWPPRRAQLRSCMACDRLAVVGQVLTLAMRVASCSFAGPDNKSGYAGLSAPARCAA